MNAGILAVAVGLLALTPMSVSPTPTGRQLTILLAGLAVMLAANALMLALSLSPLRRLTASMRTVDLLQPGERLQVSGTREVAEVIAAFNATLTRLEDERRASIGRAFSAQEAERRRIARELHDQIGQDVTAIMLDVERLRRELDGQQAPLLDEMAARVHEVLEDLRRVSYELRPAALDELGLRSAVETLCMGVERRSGIRVECSVDQDLPLLGDTVELALYRVIQEALTNAVRHARCGVVDVRLTHDREGVRLIVADDGIGMAAARPGGGIRGMRERAHMLGGTLRIGRRAVGTELVLRIPVNGR